MKLVVLAGAKQGTEIPLKKDKFVIGRASDCTLRAGSEAISRHHCAILRGERGLSVRDLGSRNGTYVNGERIKGETAISSGDTVRVGTLEFRLDSEHDINRTKKPKAKDVAEVVSRSTGSDHESDEIEDDISRWLLGPEPDNTASSRETQSFRLDETRTLSDVPAIPPQEPVAAEPGESGVDVDGDGEAKGKSKDAGKKSYGKLPPVPKKESKDSREAAADILREMTRRR